MRFSSVRRMARPASTLPTVSDMSIFRGGGIGAWGGGGGGLELWRAVEQVSRWLFGDWCCLGLSRISRILFGVAVCTALGHYFSRCIHVPPPPKEWGLAARLSSSNVCLTAFNCSIYSTHQKNGVNEVMGWKHGPYAGSSFYGTT